VLMVTLHEPDFLSLKVTVLQTADRGNTQNTLPYGFRRRRKANGECVVKHTIVGLTPTYQPNDWIICIIYSIRLYSMLYYATILHIPVNARNLSSGRPPSL